MPRSLSYIIIAFAACALLFTPRLLVSGYASWRKAGVAEQWRKSESSERKVEEFAKWAADYWTLKEGSTSPWQTLLHLPRPFRPSRHAINFLSGEGWCSQLVNASYGLFGDRSRIVQHDVIFPTAAHSAISIKLEDGRWVYIDPFYRWLFKDGERLLGLNELKQKLVQGQPIEQFAVALKPGAELGPYTRLRDAFDAKSFETMDVSINLPVKDSKHWSVGVLDGEWKDVATAGQAQNLTTHFFYLGARFSTRFRFTYRLPDVGRYYDILIYLARAARADELPAFSIKPGMEGRTIRFRLDPQQRALVIDSSHLPDGTWHAIDRFDVVAGAS